MNPVKIGLDQVDRTLNTLESGRVTRYHAAPTVAPQTNGLHQWGVLVIALHITGNTASRELLLECAGHDNGEYFGGDVPFTAKRDSAELKRLHDEIEDTARERELLLPPMALSNHDMAVLKLADTLEGLIWCYRTEVRGLVFGRWVAAYQIGIHKFEPLLSFMEIQRANRLFQTFIN